MQRPYLQLTLMALLFTSLILHTDYASANTNQVYIQPGFQGHVTVNIPMFSFKADNFTGRELEIEGITSLRTFGVAFDQEKVWDTDLDTMTAQKVTAMQAAPIYTPEGVLTSGVKIHRYVSDAKLQEFADFVNQYDLEVIWTLNVSNYTVDEELDFIKKAMAAPFNLPITKFEYGGEFYLPKYLNGDIDNKKVVEQVRMNTEYDENGNVIIDHNDYLDLLDLWIPAMLDDSDGIKYGLMQYEHILICASHSGGVSDRDAYRQNWNAKVFNYVQNLNPALNGKVSYSFHLYAGEKPALYPVDEEHVYELTDPNLFAFINEKPTKQQGDWWNNWVVTEFGTYTDSWRQVDLNEQKLGWQMLADALIANDPFYNNDTSNGNVFGVHTFYEEYNIFRSLALYSEDGITPGGQALDQFLSGTMASDDCQRWGPSFDLREIENGQVAPDGFRTFTLEMYNNDTAGCLNENQTSDVVFSTEFVDQAGHGLYAGHLPINGYEIDPQEMHVETFTVHVDENNSFEGEQKFRLIMNRDNATALYGETRALDVNVNCYPSEPQFNIDIPSQEIAFAPGEIRTVTVNYRNNNSVACAPSEFELVFQSDVQNHLKVMGQTYLISTLGTVNAQQDGAVSFPLKATTNATTGNKFFNIEIADYGVGGLIKDKDRQVLVDDTL